MSAIQRSSNVVWEGTIASGAGRLSAHSGAFTAFARLPPRLPEAGGNCHSGSSWRVSTRRPSGSPSTQ
jgi:hypothetical protein